MFCQVHSENAVNTKVVIWQILGEAFFLFIRKTDSEDTNKKQGEREGGITCNKGLSPGSNQECCTYMVH